MGMVILKPKNLNKYLFRFFLICIFTNGLCSTNYAFNLSNENDSLKIIKRRTSIEINNSLNRNFLSIIDENLINKEKYSKIMNGFGISFKRQFYCNKLIYSIGIEFQILPYIRIAKILGPLPPFIELSKNNQFKINSYYMNSFINIGYIYLRNKYNEFIFSTGVYSHLRLDYLLYGSKYSYQQYVEVEGDGYFYNAVTKCIQDNKFLPVSFNTDLLFNHKINNFSSIGLRLFYVLGIGNVVKLDETTFRPWNGVTTSSIVTWDGSYGGIGINYSFPSNKKVRKK